MGRFLEYGGYLPLETRPGEDYFSRYEKEGIFRTNSAKSAIHYALLLSGVQTLYLPYYMCDSVTAMVQSMDLKLQRYFLDENLLPGIKPEPGAAILLVNYFGVMEERVCKAAGEFLQMGVQVILDNSHAFFAKPLLRDGIWNVYSCRKFIGVPDGGYLIGTGVRTAALIDIPEEKIAKQFSYLVTSFEEGTNAAYPEKQESDRYFRGRYFAMSALSKAMLASVDYSYICQKRTENLQALHGLLASSNAFSIPDAAAPAYLYPYLPKKGEKLKERLIAEKIYVPTLWRELLLPEFSETLEYRLSKELVLLPVDQRYQREDMEELAGRVLAKE